MPTQKQIDAAFEKVDFDFYEAFTQNELIHIADAMSEYAAPLLARISELEEGDKWVSVETALPEAHLIDGKKKTVNWVLGIKGKSFFICVYTAGYELQYEDYEPDENDYDEVEERNGCHYLKPGWYTLEQTPGGEYDETWQRQTITHWRPLPSPPKGLNK